MRQAFVVFCAATTVLPILSASRTTTDRPRSSQAAQPVEVSATQAPRGVTKLEGVHWIQIKGPAIGRLLAAVARPPGPGPYSTVVVLHGSHGFAREYVQLASDLARSGLQAVAPCWFAGSSGGAGQRFVTPIACPKAPPISMASSPEALHTIDSIVQAVSQLPHTSPNRIVLFGHSRGGGAALNYILRNTGIYATVLDSTGYPPELAAVAAQVHGRA